MKLANNLLWFSSPTIKILLHHQCLMNIHFTATFSFNLEVMVKENGFTFWNVAFAPICSFGLLVDFLYYCLCPFDNLLNLDLVKYPVALF